MHSPKLQSKIEKAKSQTHNDGLIWDAELIRIRALAIKLAQGHIAYEEFTITDEPEYVFINPLCTLPAEMEDLFSYDSAESEFTLWPEIGTRAFLRAVVRTQSTVKFPSWIDVQEGRYRYKVIASSSVAIVIREYLGIYVAWT
ncbi:hypothetical protein LJB99_02470 [Deltaproteobacteria bacterium OttesenSCG-928-K17]|nr:hypothetical protein [Deltaproteobacteria bacterium OttesenSCG-928-K17]